MHEIVRTGANRSSSNKCIYDDKASVKKGCLQSNAALADSPLAVKKNFQQQSCNQFTGVGAGLDQYSQEDGGSTKFKTSKVLGLLLNEKNNKSPVVHRKGVKSVNPTTRQLNQRDTLGSALQEDDSLLRDTVGGADFQTEDAERTLGRDSTPL